MKGIRKPYSSKNYHKMKKFQTEKNTKGSLGLEWQSHK